MYDTTKCVTGWSAIFSSFGYGIWALIATSDGPRGIDIPTNVAIPAMTAIILLTVTSVVMRVGQWAAEHVIETLISDHFDLLISAVTTKLEGHQQQLQHMVKAEVAAAMQEVSSTAFRAAIVNQASQAAAATLADTNDASVTRIPAPNGRR